jgi:hypothetical protein
MTDCEFDYIVGDVIQIYTSSVFADVAGTAFDPDVITFVAKSPSGAQTTYVYGTDAEVGRAATGSYYLNLELSEAGKWRVYASGATTAGAYRGADQLSFEVGAALS